MKFVVSTERAKSEGKGGVCTYYKLHVRISENSEISEKLRIFSKASAEESENVTN